MSVIVSVSVWSLLFAMPHVDVSIAGPGKTQKMYFELYSGPKEPCLSSVLLSSVYLD